MNTRTLTRLALLAVIAAAPAAMADTLVQTDAAGPMNLFTGADVGSVAAPITVTFDQFDPMLGNLVSVQFQADFEYNGTLHLGPTTDGGSMSTFGSYLLNGMAAPGIVTGGGTGAGPATPGTSIDLNWGIAIPIDVTLNANDNPAEFATFLGNGPIDMTFDASITISAGEGSTADADLTSASYTLTYTYDVPEPGSLALLGLGGIALLRRGRA